MAAKVAQWGPDVMRYVEKLHFACRRSITSGARHLLTLEHLRQVIGLRGYGQRDPLTNTRRNHSICSRRWAPICAKRSPPSSCGSRSGRRRPRGAHLCPIWKPTRSIRATGEDEMASRPRRRRDPGAAWDYHGAGVRTRLPAIRKAGARLTQRIVSVRLGQEVQALPRALRLTAPRTARRGKKIHEGVYS